MDQPTFDRWTTQLGRLPTRRAVLLALLAAPLARGFGAAAQDLPAAPCAAYGQTCNATTTSCCRSAGVRCLDGRCTCRVRYGRCDAGPGCVKLQRDPFHCGQCGNRCRSTTPCCIDGECQPRCGDRCCPNCFVEVRQNGTLRPGSETCCERDGGTRCGSPRRDQQCCYPDEICLGDTCCGVTNRGLTDCDGECCATDACCDGICCATSRGLVCTPAVVGRRQRCISGRRSCTNASTCEPGEACDGGTCCSGLRRCYANGGASRICCPPGEWCAVQNNPALASCIPVGEAPDRTYRGHRVRP